MKLFITLFLLIAFNGLFATTKTISKTDLYNGADGNLPCQLTLFEYSDGSLGAKVEIPPQSFAGTHVETNTKKNLTLNYINSNRDYELIKVKYSATETPESVIVYDKDENFNLIHCQKLRLKN
jgi:hypothetical protein